MTSIPVLLEKKGKEPEIPVDRLTGPRYWEPALKKAKVRNFTWHCLRHTFASRLVMNGENLRTVQELMGHKQISMRVRYSHLAPHIN